MISVLELCREGQMMSLRVRMSEWCKVPSSGETQELNPSLLAPRLAPFLHTASSVGDDHGPDGGG